MKIILAVFLSLLIMVTFTGCGGNSSLFEQAHQVNVDDLTDEELLALEEGVYSDFFVFTSQEEVANWISSNPNWGNYQLVDEIESYDASFFDDNIIVVVFATWRAYSQDFFIKEQTFTDGLLSIEIQYHIPWYAFGDSWDNAYGFVVELPYDGEEPIEVQITYADR
jgi:hypothetical protein